MQKTTVSIKKLHHLAILPMYGTSYSSMADLHAFVHAESEQAYGQLSIAPGETKMIRTGLSLRPAPGYGTKVYPRSGLAITLQNCVGVIDYDDSQELRLLVRNEGNQDFVVEAGMRIAQLEVHPVVQAEFVEVDALPDVQLQPVDSQASVVQAEPVVDADALRSITVGNIMQSLGDLLMECNIESSTGVTHNSCEEVGAILRALGQNISQGHAKAVTHDKEMAHQIAQVLSAQLQKL